MIRLFTTWHEAPDERRRQDYEASLRANIDCEAIDRIHILAESGTATLPQHDKIDVRSVATRPSYDDFARWIDEIAAEADISVIANTDIHFDSSLYAAVTALRSGECFALARWDRGTLFDRNDSQDAWIFRGKLRPVRGDFGVGIPRCDNRFLHELRSAGYIVRNPAFAIRASHIHSGERHGYAKETMSSWVAPPYGYLWPHNLYSLPATLWYNATHPGRTVPWRLDRRQALFTITGRVVRRVRKALSPGAVVR